MQRIVWGAALTIGFLGLPAVGQSQALHCEDLNPTVQGDATRAFECVSVLDARLNAALSRIEALEAAAHKVPEARLVPKGAVLAFDTPDGCPEGWSHFAEGQSRVVVGASRGSFANGLAEDEGGNPLTGYKYRDHGGDSKVALSDDQLPSHRHHGVKTNLYLESGDVISRRKPVEGRRGGIDLPWLIGATSDDSVLVSTARVVDDFGGNEPHNNIPPFIALYFCKKD